MSKKQGKRGDLTNHDEAASSTSQQGISQTLQHHGDPRAGESSRPGRRVVALADCDTAKAVLAVAKGMSEEATVYDLYDKTKEMGLHSDELWEWGLPEKEEGRRLG